ncbi:Uncharacterised protein [Escherichia coli]|nr:Uncharacterised protein [Escherichia coli]SQM23256.1 Uncharacterised protein [Escherichia coli]
MTNALLEKETCSITISIGLHSVDWPPESPDNQYNLFK